jgi:hypothetical protein
MQFRALQLHLGSIIMISQIRNLNNNGDNMNYLVTGL